MSLIKKPISLLPKQTNAWDLLEEVNGPILELGYGGGAGGGKTEIGCLVAIFISDQFRGSRGAIGRYELKNLKRTTLKSFFEVAQKLGLRQKFKGAKEWDFDYNQQDGIITFNNADKEAGIPPSEILILDTAPSPKDTEYTRFGGLELTWCWIDESNETPYKAIEILGTRVGRRNYRPEWGEKLKQFFGMTDPNDPHKWILKPFFLETFNPEKGHIYSRFWKPYKNNTLPSYRGFVRALASDNPFLPAVYIQAIMRKSKATIQRLIYGNFDYDDDPQKIFSYDRLHDLFTNTHIEDTDSKKYMVIDPAGRGRDRTIISIWKGLHAYYFYEEKITDQSLLLPKIRALQKREAVPNSNTIIDYDGLGVGLGDNLKCVCFQGGTRAIVSSEQKRLNIVPDYKNLRAQCYFLLSDKINDAEIYVSNVSPDQKEVIIEELDVIKEINDGKDQKRQIIPKGGGTDQDDQETIRGLLGRSPDYADNLMMRMYFEVDQKSTPRIRSL